jgi:hypothetical protein
MMMRAHWLMAWGLIGATGVASPALASDHLDGPAASGDPAADITDLFAWVSADGAKTYFVLNVAPVAAASATDSSPASKFSDTVQYVFHVTSQASYGASVATSLNIICTFTAAQIISCWAGTEYVHGDASTSAGLSSSSGKLRVFAGPRDDPSFFNLDGFRTAANTVTAAESSVSFDSNGCPTLDPSTASLVRTQLSTDPASDGGPAKDFFLGLNVLSLVLELDTSVVNAGGPIVGVWASTNRAL